MAKFSTSKIHDQLLDVKGNIACKLFIDIDITHVDFN